MRKRQGLIATLAGIDEKVLFDKIYGDNKEPYTVNEIAFITIMGMLTPDNTNNTNPTQTK